MNFLYKIFISPIEMIVDTIFSFVINEMPQLGVFTAILFVSLCINFFALPLYNIADKLQEKERNTKKKLEYRIQKIKKAFKGDERFMMINEYYRQNNYKPIYALRSALSILIEIPFFIAAYHYLSNCQALKDASFWIFKNLGEPDNLLSFTFNGKFVPVNVLPILMTVINFVSGAIYTKDSTLSEKVQLYAVALIFLVLLYMSPSGLVIYWILNNIFSLLKNIVSKTKNPKKILYISLSALFLIVTILVLILLPDFAIIGKISLSLLTVIIVFIPLEKKFILKHFPNIKSFSEKSTNVSSLEELSKDYFWTFFISSIALTLLAGFLLPSNVISASPRDFCFLEKTSSPLSYINSTFFLFAGLFIIWPICIYKMFGEKIRKILSSLFFMLLLCSISNAFIFNHPYGEIENTFILNHPEVLNDIGPFYSILPLLVLTASFFILYFAKKFKKEKLLNIALLIICIAETSTAIFNTSKINKEYKIFAEEKKSSALVKANTIKNDENTISPVYNISSNGTNVVVIFLDRAISSFFPHILKEFPELNEQFKGFTFYPNTLSYGNYTLLGVPAMLGGYEYTPENINLRSTELLRIKHNEASLVMPKLFKDAGFDVTVTDPPFPNYTWKGDLSAFTNEGINALEIAGLYRKKYENEVSAEIVMTDKLCLSGMQYFSIIQIIYPAFRKILYNAVAHFLSDGFNNMYSCLYYMNDLTSFSDSEKNNFILIDNETTHTQAYLNIPEYDRQIPNQDPDVEKREYKTSGNIEEMHYDVNVASLKRLGLWFKNLQEHDCYDNTRIIIVSDHGRDFYTDIFKDFDNPMIPAFFNPLFLVKDFNSNGEIKTDTTFMTNADTLYIAKEGIQNISDKNPFTGKTLIPDSKEKVHIWAIQNSEWNSDNVLLNKKFTLKPEESWIVKENLFDKNNWIQGKPKKRILKKEGQ